MSIHAGIAVLNAVFAFWFLIEVVLVFAKDIPQHPLVLAVSGFLMCLLSAMTILSLLK